MIEDSEVILESKAADSEQWLITGLEGAGLVGQGQSALNDRGFVFNFLRRDLSKCKISVQKVRVQEGQNLSMEYDTIIGNYVIRRVPATKSCFQPLSPFSAELDSPIQSEIINYQRLLSSPGPAIRH